MTGQAIQRAPARACLLIAVVFVSGTSASAQSTATLESGESIYRAACAACHAADGRGAPQEIVGFDTPLPDFTDCNFASREPEADWFAISHDGGPVRGFDSRMPAFGRVLSRAQISSAVRYVKGFCRAAAWPAGELNLPRALLTEKAFPEDEAVLSTTMASGAFINEFLYERRLGARTQYEVKVPIAVQESGPAWHRGLGDIAAAVKHVLHHSRNRGSIVSASAEIVLPTGKENEGLGGGVTVFEPFVAVGQILPRDGFLQGQAGFEIAARRDASHEVFWRGVFGKSFVQGEFGRTWSPMVEVLGATELQDGKTVNWDLVPQMQVTLSKRQHIMINAGVRLPVNERSSRSAQVLTYFLWDWFDGGLFDGWR
jgi:mono/diheme cytochrome c family protein